MMRFSIVHIIVFTFLIALQIRFVMLGGFGVVVSIILVPICVFSMMVSIFGSQASDGRLMVEKNVVFQTSGRLLLLCILNLIIVLSVLTVVLNNSLYYLD